MVRSTYTEDDYPDMASTTCESTGPEALDVVDFEAPEVRPNSRAVRRRLLRRQRKDVSRSAR